jgi:hypothetical protein
VSAEADFEIASSLKLLAMTAKRYKVVIASSSPRFAWDKYQERGNLMFVVHNSALPHGKKINLLRLKARDFNHPRNGH